MPPKRAKELPFGPKDMVLAKMTGFPAWPSFVMPSDLIPDAILGAKKKTTNICVIFIPDGDFYWMNEKNLELLSPEKLQTKLSKVPKDKLKAKPKSRTARTNNVTDAFVAANGLDFDEFMDELAEKKKTVDADEDEDEESDEEDDNKEELDFPKKDDNGGPTEEQAEEEEVGEEEEIEEDTRTRRSRSRTAERPPSKRRGGDKESAQNSEKDSEASDEIEDDVSDEPAEEETQGRKRPKRGSSAPSESQRSGTPAKNGKRNREESLPAKEVFKDARSTIPKPMTEKDRQHQLWLCRIKLQRSLIQRNQPITPQDPKEFPPPTVDELSVARIILHRLADFPVSVEQLRETKIHKVLKCILKDGDLEYPDSFRLHEKCQELLDKWSDMIEDLKHQKHSRGNRDESQAPDDSEVSGIESKRTLDDYHEKVEA